MYRVYTWVASVVPKLPRSLRRLAAVVIGNLAWGFARLARKSATANVIRVLGSSSGRRTLFDRVREQLIVRRIFCNCIDNYLELFALPARPREQVVAKMDVAGIEHLEEALSLGRGAVLFSAHLGPFEYLSSWFSAHGYEMVIPVENVRDERLLRLMVTLRQSHGVTFVPLSGPKAIRTMFDTLRRNQLVLITADRAVEGEEVVVDFFGAATALPSGPVDLSLKTGAPLVGAFGWRSAGGRVSAEFTRLTMALPHDQRRQPEALQAELVRQLERAISAHLEQWVVFEFVWTGDHSRK